MDDRFIKYTKLSIIIFLLFLAVPVTFSLVFGVFYGFSGLISSRPVDVIFEIFIISLPAIIFCTAFTIFFARTKYHPSKIVRVISYTVFIICIASCIFFLVTDLLYYFHVHRKDIENYQCFEIWFLAGNIGTIFKIGRAHV